jgi:Uma2 family endonuclease
MADRVKKALRAERGNVTFDEFCQRIREDQKADLIDGVIYMASPENLDAHRLFRWLYRLMTDFVEETDGGEIFGSRVAFRLNDINTPEPDIAFLRKDQLHRAIRGVIEGPPDLAIEIVSPDSVERDYEAKRLLYQRSGVQEYWIIDEHEELIILYRLDGRGVYREVKPRKGELVSQSIPGFWLKIEWLWQHPRPRKDDCLRQILARRAAS